MLLAALLALLLDATAADATLKDVEFMSGHWVNDEGGALSEEIWSEPSGDGMMGMWRYVAGGEARVLELLSLSRSTDGVTLRLRHFDARLVAREDKETPVVLRLVSRKPGEAVFEGPAVGGPGTVKLTYRRESADSLSSTLEKGGKPQTFRFRRAAAR